MAFYDDAPTGAVAGCAYLVTTEQFADVAAQEMRRPFGGKFAHDLTRPLPDVETMVDTRRGLYEKVVRVGELDGVPMFTITHHDIGSLTLAAPTEAYLRWIVLGLRESHGHDDHHIAGYLARASGIRDVWTESQLHRLAAATERVKQG